MCPRLLNTIDLSLADNSLMRSSFVDPDFPSLLCMVMVSPSRVIYLLVLRSAIVTRFITTTTNLATHSHFPKSCGCHLHFEYSICEEHYGLPRFRHLTLQTRQRL